MLLFFQQIFIIIYLSIHYFLVPTFIDKLPIQNKILHIYCC